VLLDLLVDEGVHYVFGNPGSTELALIDELCTYPQLRYIHALQENTAVGMADGFAMASGSPAFVNLHTLGGLGGGMSNLTNAAASRTPLIITAGQQHRDRLVRDPVLSGDLVGLARPVTKWAHELRTPDEIGVIFRRAFKDARTPPQGPIFVSIPMDVLDEPASPPPVKSRVELPGSAKGVDDLAARLAATDAQQLAIVVGDGAGREPAFTEVVTLAEWLGCAVFGAAFCSVNPFPTAHPAWQGYLPLHPDALNATLSSFERVLVIGAPAFLLYEAGQLPPLPESVELLHIDDDPTRVGRNERTTLGLCGDIAATIEAVIDELKQQRSAAPYRSGRVADGQPRLVPEDHATARPMHPRTAVTGCLDGLPPGAVVVDEAVTSGRIIKKAFATSGPGEYYFCRGAALGWGMPASLGVALAKPQQPVICFVGDGAAAYSIQSLWTAAHEQIPVVFIVLNNGQYRILKDGLTARDGASAKTDRYVAMDLTGPAPDYVQIASGFGVDAQRVEQPSELRAAVGAAVASRRPALIDVPITGADTGGRG
jgi:benzoylformate decarboxylase